MENEIREEIKNFLEAYENELTTIQNLWDTAKAVMRGKFITIQAILKILETAQINTIRNERRENTTDTIEIQRFVRNY